MLFVSFDNINSVDEFLYAAPLSFMVVLLLFVCGILWHEEVPAEFDRIMLLEYDLAIVWLGLHLLNILNRLIMVIRWLYSCLLTLFDVELLE